MALFIGLNVIRELSKFFNRATVGYCYFIKNFQWEKNSKYLEKYLWDKQKQLSHDFTKRVTSLDFLWLIAFVYHFPRIFKVGKMGIEMAELPFVMTKLKLSNGTLVSWLLT